MNTTCNINIGNYNLTCFDLEETSAIYEEIYIEGIYLPKWKLTQNPLIIDIGAHTGLSTFYFKSIFPKSKIIAIEANNNSFELLKRNIQSNGLSSEITCIYGFANHSDGESQITNFSTRPSISGYLNKSWQGGYTKESETKFVHNVNINEFSKKYSSIDLLKIDIEGYEHELIPNIKDTLKISKQIVMELHPISSRDLKSTILVLKSIFKELIYTANGQVVDTPSNTDLTMVYGRV